MENIEIQQPRVENNGENESNEGLLNKLKSKLHRLKMLGVVLGTLGTMLVVENASAQMKEGTISADSMLYKMKEKEAKEVSILSNEVDDLVHVLKNTLKEKKYPVTRIDEFRDKEKVSSFPVYIYNNIKISVEGGWELDYEGDTLKYHGDKIVYQGKEYADESWIVVSDLPLNAMGNEDTLSKETFTFGKNSNDSYEVESYGNKTKEEYGEEMTTYEYGDNIAEENAIMVQHFSQKADPEKHNTMFDGGGAEKNTVKKLEYTLKRLKDNVTVAITSIKEIK